MNIRILGVVAAAALLGACTTTANTQSTSNLQASETAAPVDATGSEAAPASAEAQVAEADGTRVICKRTQITGSRFKKKVCMTWNEWKELENTSRDLMLEGQRRSTKVDVPSGG